MRRVLCAYAAHNDRVGYCRGLNSIVGLLLARALPWAARLPRSLAR
jgi:hypothetical protein